MVHTGIIGYLTPGAQSLEHQAPADADTRYWASGGGETRDYNPQPIKI